MLMKTCQFTVINSNTGDIAEYLVEGTTYSPEGAIKLASGKSVSLHVESESIRRLAEISAVCNDAKIVYDEVCNLS